MDRAIPGGNSALNESSPDLYSSLLVYVYKQVQTPGKKDASTTSLRACIVSITGPHQTSALTHGSSLLSAALFRKSCEQRFVSEILDIVYNNT